METTLTPPAQPQEQLERPAPRPAGPNFLEYIGEDPVYAAEARDYAGAFGYDVNANDWRLGLTFPPGRPCLISLDTLAPHGLTWEQALAKAVALATWTPVAVHSYRFEDAAPQWIGPLRLLAARRLSKALLWKLLFGR